MKDYQERNYLQSYDIESISRYNQTEKNPLEELCKDKVCGSYIKSCLSSGLTILPLS